MKIGQKPTSLEIKYLKNKIDLPQIKKPSPSLMQAFSSFHNFFSGLCFCKSCKRKISDWDRKECMHTEFMCDGPTSGTQLGIEPTTKIPGSSIISLTDSVLVNLLLKKSKNIGTAEFKS